MTPKSVKTVKDPAIAWAEQLWKRLETDLFNVEKTIIAIIETKAWEPLGYESFSKAWIDKIMSKVAISSELRPHVVYQMFSEGLTADQVADAVKGLLVPQHRSPAVTPVFRRGCWVILADDGDMVAVPEPVNA